jgi:hypothetical protein
MHSGGGGRSACQENIEAVHREERRKRRGAENCNCFVVASVYSRGPLREATINLLLFSAPLRFLRSSL